MQRIMLALVTISLLVSMLAGGVSVFKAGKSVTADFSVSGSTANCTVSVKPEKATDSIELTVQIICGSSVVAEWRKMSSQGTLLFSETATLRRGETYIMRTKCKINGTEYPIADITKKSK